MAGKRNKHNECYSCQHRREIPGDAHSRCVSPDSQMEGHERGIRGGWFHYPSKFDPVWKLVPCANYKAKEKTP